MKNYNKIIFKLILTLTIFILGSQLYLHCAFKKFNAETIKINISTIGSILEKSPELESTIMQSFSLGFNEDNYKRGIEFTKKYGYIDSLPISSTSSLNNFYKTIKFNFFILTLTLSIAILLLLLNTFNKLHHSIKEFSLGTDKIMDGSFDLRLPYNDESQLAMLAFNFNQMSKRLELTLNSLKKEKNHLKDMISNISHQFKTPLSSLLAFNELLLDGAMDDKEICLEFLNRSNVQLKRMEWLIQSLLKISRLEAEVIHINKNFEDIYFTLIGTVNSFKMKFIEKNQVIKLDLIPNMSLPHDKEWLGEAIGNIVNNAIEYTPNGKEISIFMEETETLVRIVIKDSGVGISEDELPLIFDKFFRGASSRNSFKNSSGIGLALSKLVIEKHGAFIQVDSNLNEGTSFTLTFPKVAL
ncbi:sensor histidine kinase [Clostridium sp. MSJ-11]|uniref:histidine kinase n=1 Tax=Clostridium mobile TaxID=2841512 RepID=A0ABS6EK23_9CLOT|nr:ATP-binding protein [Clostridium mobile]MBU5485566.1 sensor histidine kinase [Clostridium mobile]